MASGQEREQLDARARQGETVVPGGTGGKTLEAQEHLAQGRSRGGHTRKEQMGTEGYQEMGHRGRENRREQMGTDGVPGDGPERGPQHQQQVWRGVRGGRDRERRVQIQNQE